jgi:hypothetical protein
MHMLKRTQADPITGRNISDHCWNTHHEGTESHILESCATVSCNCMCHDWRLRPDGTIDWEAESDDDEPYEDG